MKKILALVLALCMIFALCACGQSAAPAEQPAKNEAPAADGAAPAEDAAVEEDLGDTLVLYSSMTEADLDALKTCFNEVYPDIEIEVISGSAGEFTAKIQAEAGNPQGDVTWGGLADSDGDKYAEIFEAWVSDNDDEQMEGYSTPNGFYSMDHLSTVCFCVNTELEKELGLNIQSYEDLLDPALKGKIVISDPNSSSAAWNNLCNIFSVYGIDTDEAWDYIDALLENMVVVEKSSVCFNSVSDGEYVVGLTYEDGAIKLNQSAAEVTASDGKTTRVENSAFNCFTINKNAGTTSIDTAHGDGMTLSINGNILTATSAQGVDHMELITPDGRTVAAYSGRSRQAAIDVGSCRAGIYIVKASSGKHTTTKKIIIK